MEEIALMVSASLARNGFSTRVDHRRLQWSQWSRFEFGFNASLAPSKPGVFALAEEVRVGGHEGSHDLKQFEISESEDLGMALGCMSLPNSPEQTRLAGKSCYMRYAVIEDSGQRNATCRALQESIASSSAPGNGIPNNMAVHTFAENPHQPH